MIDIIQNNNNWSTCYVDQLECWNPDGFQQKHLIRLIYAPARTFFNDDGTIMDAPGCHGGNNFSYIRAMRQIGEETGTPVLDLFSYSVELFEKIGHDNIHRYTSIKKGINKGKWPDDFLKELAKPDTVSENTHFNKDGAMLITEGLVELILKSKNPQLCELQSSLLHNVV